MVDQTEIEAIAAKIRKQSEDFSTVALPAPQALALLQALDAKDARIAELEERLSHSLFTLGRLLKFWSSRHDPPQSQGW